MYKMLSFRELSQWCFENYRGMNMLSAIKQAIKDGKAIREGRIVKVKVCSGK